MNETETNRQTLESGRQRIAVLVLGMHRSGTSAVSRLLSLLGCELPRHLLGPGPGNVLGHWESEAIWHFNDELLASGHSSWEDWLAFDSQWYDTTLHQSFVERGRDLLRQEFGSAPLFVLKDPRNCRLVPFWRDVLERELIRPVVVIALRHPDEVAQSLATRSQFGPDYTQHLWLRHLLDAEAETRNVPRIVATYDQLLEDWQALAARMEKAFGFFWPDRSISSATAIADFLSAELRHHRLSSHEPYLPNWVSEVYQTLNGWAQSGEDKSDHARLDQIRRDLNVATPNFARLVSAAAGDTRLNHALEAKSLAQCDEIAALSVARDLVEHERQAVDEERTALRQQLTQQRRNADDEAAAAAAELGRERETSILLRAELTDLRKQIADVRTQLADAENSLRRLGAEHRQAEGREQLLKVELAEAELALAAAAAQVEPLISGLDQAGLYRAELETAAIIAADAIKQQSSQIHALSNRLVGHVEMAAAATSRIEWLITVLTLLISPPKWCVAMLKPWRQWQIHELLRRNGLFDAKSYLRQHADVAEHGMDPLRHYILHGMGEGRLPLTVIRESSAVDTGSEGTEIPRKRRV